MRMLWERISVELFDFSVGVFIDHQQRWDDELNGPLLGSSTSALCLLR